MMKIQKYNLHIISKRYISDITEFKNLLEEINNSNSRILKAHNVEPNPILDHKYKECTKIDNISYETNIKTEEIEGIIENIKETNDILKQIRMTLDNIKSNNNNVEVEVINSNLENNNTTTEIFNDVVTNDTILNNININTENLINTNEAIYNTNIFSQITDYIYSLTDMLNTPGRIVLFTIGAGIVIGGTYYFGNTIKDFIFKKNVNIPIQPIQTPIIINMPEIKTKDTFFKLVGERILKLLDIMINKYQFKKYK